MTNTALKAQINSQITNETLPNTVSPTDVGGNLKAVVDYIDQQVPFNQWIARISNTAVDTVIKDGISFTAPVVANPFNGIVTITKTGFFTGNLASKIEVEVENYNNAGSLFICTATQDDVFPNDTIKITLFPKDGAITGTPSFSGLLVKIKIYE